MLSPEVITVVIQSLAQSIDETVSSPADHTMENLNVTATILTVIAEEVENQTIVDDIVKWNIINIATCVAFCVLDYRSSHRDSYFPASVGPGSN